MWSLTEAVQKESKRLPFTVVEGDDKKPMVELETKEGQTQRFAPEEISAMVLGRNQRLPSKPKSNANRLQFLRKFTIAVSQTSVILELVNVSVHAVLATPVPLVGLDSDSSQNHGSVSAVSPVSTTNHSRSDSFSAAFSVALRQKVMSEISQKIKSVIKFVIRAGHVQVTQQSRHQRSQTQRQGLLTSE
eukprot:4007857-Amphidinium_carterae.2